MRCPLAFLVLPMQTWGFAAPGFAQPSCWAGPRQRCRSPTLLPTLQEQANARDPSSRDPFRPARHPLEPVAINLLRRALFAKPRGAGQGVLEDPRDRSLERILAVTRAARVAPSLRESTGIEIRNLNGSTISGIDGDADDERLSVAEWATIEGWVRAVAVNQQPLEAALEAAAAAHPWVAKFQVKIW